MFIYLNLLMSTFTRKIQYMHVTECNKEKKDNPVYISKFVMHKKRPSRKRVWPHTSLVRGNETISSSQII